MIIGQYTDPLQFKHEAYEFEREVRIMISKQKSWKRNPKFLYRQIPNLSELITSVVVAPESEVWFFDIVQDLVHKYGLKIPVRMSQLAVLPR